MFGHSARSVVRVSDEESECQEAKAQNPQILQESYKPQISGFQAA
jgi:hypothetical protein